ncbi:carboxymuconolactone decarboxylase family protein [Egibacter rhizosphaerae]|uniref:Carboxymuconolactone decarboxylase family protein n=1 Tax=Egibacter rhizosphaerae TaxID=1670831 RepID=A0A411YBC7_9ACTN|nr:carboxymuconolactone decarboxylase family protein [Egibacter rhizosphaerae]QBI18485.1 carboxymuconolactone decarboxylase family protein [Egibacter rhizosphaerae]
MRWVRAGLAVLAVGQLVPGMWALAAPRHFYESFPGVGSAWVAADGPFNHHLVVDAGAGFAATGLVLAVAVWVASRAVRAVALAGYLVHAVPHLAYHVAHPPLPLGPVEQALTWLPLAGGVGLAVVLLLVMAVRSPPARASARPDSRPGAGPVPAPSRSGFSGGRISGIGGSPRNPLLRLGFIAARRRLGAIPEAWRVTARVPRVALARMAGDAAHQRTRLAPASVGAVAQLHAATLVECAFCVDIGTAAAVDAGVTREQIRDLPRWRDSDRYDDDQRLALSLADAMTATPAEVPGDLVDALVTRFGADATVELATAVGHENARARTNRALGVPPQGFAAAASCPLPERSPT